MDQVVVVRIGGAQVVFANVRCNCVRDQAVLTEVVDDAVEDAFQKQVSVLDEDSIDLARREGTEARKGLAWSRRPLWVMPPGSARPASASDS